MWQLFRVFFALGCTSFGGPVAHLGYFHAVFVVQRRWYSEQDYADLVALCQFLPGPASSQVGMAIGFNAAGYSGAIVSWLGFTLPSALVMATFAYVYLLLGQGADTLWLSALKIVAVAVVAQALWQMGRKLCPDTARASIAVISATILLMLPGTSSQLAVIIVSAVVGYWYLPARAGSSSASNKLTRAAFIAVPLCFMLLFILLLLTLPILAETSDNALLKLFDHFFRAGALVFGGGHVVLPLLQSELVPTGWMTNDTFLAGYGAAQGVPGPLFTVATYLGVVSASWQGGLVATVAIFLPAFLLLFATLPLWQSVRQLAALQSAMAGINAAVVGILLAVFYQPVFRSAITDVTDFACALLAFSALMYWRLPPWLVVVVSAFSALLIGHFE